MARQGIVTISFELLEALLKMKDARIVRVLPSDTEQYLSNTFRVVIESAVLPEVHEGEYIPHIDYTIGLFV